MRTKTARDGERRMCVCEGGVIVVGSSERRDSVTDMGAHAPLAMRAKDMSRGVVEARRVPPLRSRCSALKPESCAAFLLPLL